MRQRGLRAWARRACGAAVAAAALDAAWRHAAACRLRAWAVRAAQLGGAREELERAKAHARFAALHRLLGRLFAASEPPPALPPPPHVYMRSDLRVFVQRWRRAHLGSLTMQVRPSLRPRPACRRPRR